MEIDRLLTSIIVLACLAVLTVFVCIRKPPYQSYGEFLYRASNETLSLTSAAGSVFTISFFYGGMHIYGIAYGAIFLPFLLITFFLAYNAVSTILTAVMPILESPSGTPLAENILLEHLRKTLSPENSRVIIFMIATIMWLMVAVEVGLGRLIIHSLFPNSPFAAPILITTICAVCVVYISAGGFKAVLVSDFVQFFCIVAFIVASLYVMLFQSPSDFDVIGVLQGQSTSKIGFLLSAGIIPFGVFWALCSVDLFSRFNFDGRDFRRSKLLLKKSFAVMFAIILYGLVFSIFSFGAHSEVMLAPQKFPQLIQSAFFSTGIDIIPIILLVSLFVMIFTTLDNYIIAMVQTRVAKSIGGKNLSGLPAAVALAIVVSSLVDLKFIILSGFLVGSLFCFPGVMILYLPRTKNQPNLRILGGSIFVGLLTYAGLVIVLWDFFVADASTYFGVPLIAAFAAHGALLLANLTGKLAEGS